MPMRDGTGPPEGGGPMTGRGLGQQDPMFQLGCMLNQFMPHNVLKSFAIGMCRGGALLVGGESDDVWNRMTPEQQEAYIKASLRASQFNKATDPYYQKEDEKRAQQFVRIRPRVWTEAPYRSRRLERRYSRIEGDPIEPIIRGHKAPIF